MVLVLIQRPYTLLQGKKTFVYFSPVDPGLLLNLVCVVSCPFAARQVDESDLSMQLVLPLQTNLQNRMGAGRIIVSSVLGGHPCRGPERNVLHEIATAGDFCFRKSNDVDVVLVVLPK